MSSNPFATQGWDPFGDDPPPPPQPAAAAQQQQQQQQDGAAAAPPALKPARAPPPVPPRPRAAAAAAPATTTADDPFGLGLDVIGAPPPAPAAAPLPPPPPPSYDDAAALPPPPPPPVYDAALDLPPPPSYEELFAVTGGSGSGGSSSLGGGGGSTTAAAQPRSVAPSRPPPPVPPQKAAAAGNTASGLAPSRPPPPRPPVSRAHPQSAAAVESATDRVRGLGLANSSASSFDIPESGTSSDDGGAPAYASGYAGGAAAPSELNPAAAEAGFGSDLCEGRPECRPLSVAARPSGDRPLCAHLRLAPLRPKDAAPLRRLLPLAGSLFAAPVGDAGELLQWSLAAPLMGAGGTTLPVGGRHCQAEDWDSAPAARLAPRAPDYGADALPIPGRISCFAAHPPSGRLWAGGLDGRVHCWHVGSAPGEAARWLHTWAAHTAKVKAIAVSPHGRVFTGSARGDVRMWSYDAAPSPAAPPRQARNLRSLAGGAPHGRVGRLALGPGGRVLWSAGRETLNLWSAFNGQHLGTISHAAAEWDGTSPGGGGGGGGGLLPGAVTGLVASVAGGGPPPFDPAAINPRAGVDAAALARARGAVYAPDEGEGEEAEDTAKEALKTVAKGAIKAGKLLGKLGRKIQEAAAYGAAQAAEGAGFGASGGGGGGGAFGAERTSSFGSGAAMPRAGSGGSLDAAYGGGGGSNSGSGPRGGRGGAGDRLERWGAIKALEPGPDGSVWVGYKRGLLERYSETGKLLWSSSVFAPGVTAAARVGDAMWVGGLDGRVWVVCADSGQVVRSWRAHSFPVAAIAGGAGPAAATLAHNGSVRLWPAARQPPPAAIVAEWRAATAAPGVLSVEKLRVLAATWNVNEGKPSRAGLGAWLGARSAVADVALVGLQEVEMGAGSVALGALYAGLNARARLEAGTERAQAWAAEVAAALDGGAGAWRRVAMRQMSGVVVLAFVRAALERHVGEVSTTAVACGVMGVGGNKGAVAATFSLFRRRIVVLSSHFAAHQDKVAARNADYAKIVRSLRFHDAAPAAAAGGAGGAVGGSGASDDGAGGSSGEAWGSGLRDADLLVWVGDFNYRIDAPPGFAPVPPETPEAPSKNDQLYAFVHARISERRHRELVGGDQLVAQARAGAAFVGLAEGPIGFLPTYKFEKGRESSERQPFYDQGEKRRVPAWTDRVLFRGGAPQPSALAPGAGGSAGDVKVALAGGDARSYGACLGVSDSDHKPVYCLLDVSLPAHAQDAARRAAFSALAAAAGGAGAEPRLSLSPAALRLSSGGGGGAAVARLTNDGRAPAAFVVASASDASAGALPSWLEVSPVSGVIAPGGCVELLVQASAGGGAAGSAPPPQWGATAELVVAACAVGVSEAAAWPASGMSLRHNSQSLHVSLG